MSEGVRLSAWRLPDQELQDTHLRVPPASWGTRYQPQMRGTASNHVPVRLNPNRFSDPFNKTGFFRTSFGLQSARPQRKAHTWYLANGLPWRQMHDSPGLCKEDSYSLFGDSGYQHHLPAIATTYDGHSGTISRRAAPGHIFNTWERCKREILGPSYVSGDSLRVGHGIRSPHGYGPVALSPRHSPGSSQKSSPRGEAVNFGLYPRVGPASRSAHTSPCSSLRSSYVRQWVDNSSNRSSPFASSAHTASSSREEIDTSYGSETDDDFFYVSCQQLTRGLADLSFRQFDRSPRHGRFLHPPQPSPRGRAQENPSFCFPLAQSSQVGSFEDDVFDNYSDDALSDDVFLDNPDPPHTVGRLSPRSAGSASPRPRGDREDRGGGRRVNDADEHTLESLRRNSLQNKRRQVWQNRRSRTSNRRSKQFSFSGESSASSRVMSPRPDFRSYALSSTSSSGRRESNMEARKSPGSALDSKSPLPYDSEKKSCFHYVMSPTDDVDMPEVIAVRKSSVELIKWQNSLRRRRRRQAKRHDLGSSKKWDSLPVASNTV